MAATKWTIKRFGECSKCGPAMELRGTVNHEYCIACQGDSIISSIRKVEVPTNTARRTSECSSHCRSGKVRCDCHCGGRCHGAGDQCFCGEE